MSTHEPKRRTHEQDTIEELGIASLRGPNHASRHRRKKAQQQHAKADTVVESCRTPPTDAESETAAKASKTRKPNNSEPSPSVFWLRWDSAILTVTLIVLGIYTYEAHRQTVLLQNTLILGQRAWLGVEGMVSSQMVVGKPTKIITTLKNTGKSPATNIEQYYFWQYLPVGFEEVLARRQKPRPSPIISHSTLFPEIPTPIEITTDPVTAQQMKIMTDKTAALYVYGKISYHDVFAREHWTTYCFYSFGDSPYWRVCQTGNHTDDEDRHN